MQKTLIIANWKANKTKEEALDFCKKLLEEKRDFTDKEIVICPPFTLLDQIKNFTSDNNLNIEIGAQDVSQFPLGAYTGEIAADQVRDFSKYVIIGHSERRNIFLENDSILFQKVSAAVSSGLIPVFCVSSFEMEIPKDVKIIAYEPLDAIGTGNPDSPDDASVVASKIKDKNKQVEIILYGGSVNSENVSSFTSAKDINGVLVGNSSLDSSEFLKIVENA